MKKDKNVVFENGLLLERVFILKLIIGFLVVVIFIFGLFIYQNKNSKKAVDQTQIEKIVALARDNEQPKDINVKYRSEKYGYEFNFDNRVWQDNGPTNARMSESDLLNVYFKTKSSYGNALVTFNVVDKGSFEIVKDLWQKDIKNKGKVEDDLDKITDRNVDSSLKYGIQNKRKLISRERIKIGEYEANKLVYSEKSFIDPKQIIDSENYILVENGRSYSFLIGATKYGETPNLVNQLLASFSFFDTNENNSGDVKGATTDKSEKSEVFSEVQLAELVKPSVVGILHVSCYEINLSQSSQYLSDKYSFCQGAEGSGFVIQKDGYVATNGHVVKTYPEQAVVDSILAKDESLVPFIIGLIRESYYEYGQELSYTDAMGLLSQMYASPSSLDNLVSIIYKLMDAKVLSFKETGTKYYVRLGDKPFEFNKNYSGLSDMVKKSDLVIEADLTDYEFPNFYTSEVMEKGISPKGSDVAILKVKNSGQMVFPALELGTVDNLKEGSQSMVIGYPGLVEGSDNGSGLVDYNTSSYKPTVTRGIVSSIKNDLSGNKLIQTDASIDHGNSGGPAFTMDGKIIGIATYGFESSSGNYNFLRDIGDLKKVAVKNNLDLTSSPSYADWEKGLNNYWIQYYKKSLTYFNKVKSEYIIHPSVDQFIDESKSGIKNGEDKEINWVLYGEIVGGILIIGGIIVVILIIKRKKAKQQLVNVEPLPQTPTTLTPPPTLS